MTDTAPDEIIDVAVEGGTLRVARWGRGPRTVLAAHGLTGTHMHFSLLAQRLSGDITLLAPDLRGRGASKQITGPFHMAAHADDLAHVLDAVGTPRADVVVGHSMGAFVAVVFADRHSEQAGSLVLVDGGMPLDLGPLADLPPDELLGALVGPALERLRMTFPSPDAYFDYWRAHPAFRESWSPAIERVYAYELTGEPPQLRPAVSEAAVLADSESQLTRGDVPSALARLRCPAVLLYAPRGILNQEPGLYTDAAVEEHVRVLPGLRAERVADVNHYTILLTAEGAGAVATQIGTELAREEVA